MAGGAMNMLLESPANELFGVNPDDLEAAISRARDRLAWVMARPAEERMSLMQSDTTYDAAVIVHLSERLRVEGPAIQVAPGDLQLGPLELSSARFFVRWHGEYVTQTKTQFKIIRLLASQPGIAVTYSELYRCHRPEGFRAGNGETGFHVNVRTFIKRIRKAFEAVDPSFDEIVNQTGVGYIWRAPRRDGR